MTHIQIREVPEPVVALLKSEAAEQGLSLQGFLIQFLQREADRVRQRQIIDRWPLGQISEPLDIAAMIREQRDERTQQLLDAIGPAK